MNYMEIYNQWLESDYFDADTKKELENIKGNEKEIEDRFYTDLEFGTAGLRGIIAAGTNRINIYTVRRATFGLANYIIKNTTEEEKARGVVIAHDNRHMSREFCLEAANTLAACGIKAYIFDSLRTTPELSFAVRKLHTIAGIVITASHNPPEYNGPDLRGWIDATLRDYNCRTMLWYKLWDREELPDDMTMDNGQGGRCVDPSNPKYREYIRDLSN